MQTSMLRALIADDHPIMREGLKLFLICNMDIEVEEASSGQEAIEYVRTHDDLDILILDISMPGMDGLETLRIVRQLKPELPVLILSAYSEDQYALRALRGGARGYLMKTSATEELVEAVQRIVEGGTYLSPSIADRVTAQLRGEETLPHHLLSEREFEVMRKIASGKTLTQISQELKLSIKTVSTYRSRILEKMKFRDNADITHYAIRHGLLGDPV
jgi:DNA-binding NarL/FixJ family response regulator